jgi:cholesterol transport system auxiliary component
MSRSIHRLLSSRVTRAGAACAALVAVGLLAAGCTSTPAALSDIRYDFGPPKPASSAGTQPAVKVLDVSAPEVLRSDKLVYRIGYADSQ